MDYYLVKIIGKLLHLSDEKLCKMICSSFRKKGMKVGANCRIYSDIGKSEPFLIELGNNVTISNDVQIITHDNSIIKIDPNYTDYFGRVVIEDDCFIGARSIVLPGVTIHKNSIVGAGSVVTRSVAEGTVVAGNPAKLICSITQYKDRVLPYGVNYPELLNRIRDGSSVATVLEKEKKLIKK